jgi:integrase/recombinase XerC
MIESFLRFIEFEKRYSSHTLISYKNDLSQFQEHLDTNHQNILIQDADHYLIRSWIIFLSEEELKPRSINRKIASLKSFYKFLLRREVITINPTTKLRLLKTEKNLPQFIKESEMDNLLDHLHFEESFSGKRDKLMIELLYNTGIRLSELVNLKIANVSLYDQTIKVLGKRNKERVIPISSFIVNLIKDYIKDLDVNPKGENEVFLIRTDKMEKVYPVFVYRTIKHYLGKVSYSEKKSPHVLRHTFATHLLNKGADLNAVKDLLGHTSLAATQVYTHNSLDKLKKVFDQAHPKA